jgi:hypothetical protein
MASSDSATRNSPNRSVNFMLHCTQTVGGGVYTVWRRDGLAATFGHETKIPMTKGRNRPSQFRTK